MPDARAARALALTLGVAAIGCASGGSVRFRGTVIGAPVPGAQYEDRAASGEPVPGAVVRVCHCHQPCTCDADAAVRTVRCDASGRFEVPVIAFGEAEGGMVNLFVVQADAPGFERGNYTLDYDKPTEADLAQREHPTFLNFRLRRAAR